MFLDQKVLFWQEIRPPGRMLAPLSLENTEPLLSAQRYFSFDYSLSDYKKWSKEILLKEPNQQSVKTEGSSNQKGNGWCLIKDLKQYIFLGIASANDRIHFLVLHFFSIGYKYLCLQITYLKVVLKTKTETFFSDWMMNPHIYSPSLYKQSSWLTSPSSSSSILLPSPLSSLTFDLYHYHHYHQHYLLQLSLGK